MAATRPAPSSTSGAANLLRYDALERGKNTIRVLSFEDTTEESDATTSILTCRLETVDLDAWTPNFHRFRNEMRSEYQRTFSASELAVAQMDSMDLSRWRVSRQLDSHAPTTQPQDSFLDTPGDLYFADGKTLLEHRFSWGDYLALSYVWGNGVADHKIVINGQDFMVRSNLYDALRRLHKSEEVCKARLKVWIDAICINQDDMMEREHEVPKMRMIYAQALCVRAWLGKPPAGLAQHFAALRPSQDPSLPRVKLPEQKPAREDDDDDESGSEGTSEDQEDESGSEDEELGSGPPAKKTEHLSAAIAAHLKTQGEKYVTISFFELGYWKRLWILQEIALAHSVVFWYGDSWVSSRHLSPLTAKLITGLERDKDKEEMLADICETMRRLRHDKAEAADGLRPPRMALHCTAVVLLASGVAATDERDRVYGTLGFVSESVSRLVKVDYGPSVSGDDAYIQFSMACILAEGNPAVRAGLVMSHRQFHGRALPSWAFDLDKRAEMWQWKTYSITRQHAEQQKPHRVTIKFSNDGRLILTCRGTVLDKITHVIPVLDPHHQYPRRPSNSSADAHAVILPPRKRLEIARALLQNPRYEFEDGHSPLDIPRQAIREYFSIMATGIPAFARTTNPVFDTLAPTLSAMSICYDLPFETGQYLDPPPEELSEPEMIKLLWSIEKRVPPNPVGFIVMSKQGLFGSAPGACKSGDVICLLAGSQEPVILRWCEDRSAYLLIEACFMEAVMIGRGQQWAEERGLKETSIDIC